MNENLKHSEDENAPKYFIWGAFRNPTRHPYFDLTITDLEKFCFVYPHDTKLLFTTVKLADILVTVVSDPHQSVKGECARINNQIYEGCIVIAGKSEKSENEIVGLTLDECNAVYELIEWPETGPSFAEIVFKFKSSRELETIDRRPLRDD